jgi:hypothetical protein
MTEPSRPRTIRLTTDELDAIMSRVAVLAGKEAAREVAHEATKSIEARLKALEDAMKSGKGALIGAAAVLGFLLADGIQKIKHLLGITT